jgi:cytochrome c-type biogenesis protein CcmH
VLLLLLAGVAASQEPVTDDEVNEIARQLYCPVCENTPLDVCPTQACQDWRQEIRTQLAQGKSRSEIEQYFVDRYGARVLAEPPRSGFNTIIWLLPIAAVVIGGVVFFRYLRDIRVARANGPDDDTVDVTQPAASAPPAADDDYISRVEKELRE